MKIAVRFQESTRYDIQRDANVVRMMATLSNGTFYTDVELSDGKSLRESRQAFKAAVVDAIGNGENPREITL